LVGAGLDRDLGEGAERAGRGSEAEAGRVAQKAGRGVVAGTGGVGPVEAGRADLLECGYNAGDLGVGTSQRA
jgi:hypothetical protein